jgi:hypothetical protein
MNGSKVGVFEWSAIECGEQIVEAFFQTLRSIVIDQGLQIYAIIYMIFAKDLRGCCGSNEHHANSTNGCLSPFRL